MRKILLYFIIATGLLSSNVLSANPLKVKENKQISPYTGYTRAHWLEITEQLIAGA